MCKSTPNSGSDLVLVPDFRLRGRDFSSDLVLVRPAFARPEKTQKVEPEGGSTPETFNFF